MKTIPNVLVLDDFYVLPDEIRKFALSLTYASPLRSNYPGQRTQDLSVCAPDFFEMWRGKFLDIFGGCHDGDWQFSTQFQRIPTDVSDPEANEGWVHSDPSEDIGAVIYLNANPDPKAGTSIMRPRPGILPHINSHLHYRNDYYGGRNNITTEEFVRAKATNNAKYMDDVVVSNVYNRLVAFNCKLPHKHTTFGKTEDNFRLTQVFFARKL